MEDSPSLEMYKDGIPEPPPDPRIKIKMFRIAIGVMAGFLLLLAIVYLLFQRSMDAAANSGAATGRVVLADGTPVQAEVFLSGSDTVVVSDADGRFTLTNLSVGKHQLVVAFEYHGQEIEVELTKGVVTDIGSVTVEHNPRMETAP